MIVLLLYERFPDFCYNCGFIGHSFRDCEVEPEEKGKLSYGSWLRAVYKGQDTKPKQPSPTKSSGNHNVISKDSASGAVDGENRTNSWDLIMHDTI